MISKVLEDLTVVKRSGQRVAFNGPKIAVAIKSSFDDVFETYDENQVNFVYNKVIDDIISEYDERKTINVEDIQDIIEKNLKKHGFNEVYDSFSSYRNKRKVSRETYQVRKEHKFNKVIEQISLALQSDKKIPTIQKYIGYGKEISKEYARSYLIDNKYIRMFDEGYIYIHNLDTLGSATIDSYNLDLSSIKKQDINIFTQDLIEIIKGIKCDIAGYLNVPNIDEIYKEVFINDFRNNLNINIKNYLSLEGFDEFININKIEEQINRIQNISDIDILYENYTNEHVKNIFIKAINDTKDVCLNKLENNLLYLFNNLNNLKIYLKNRQTSFSLSCKNTYENTLIKEKIIKIINENVYFENVYVTFKINKSSDLTNILKITDKNIYFQNDYEENAEYFPSGEKAYENVWGENTSLGKSVNLMTTINLARLGITNKTIEDYIVELGIMLDQVENELLQGFELIGNKYKDNFNYLYNNDIFTNIDIEDGQKIRKIIKNGTIEIGFVGLYESIVALEKRFNTDDAIKVLTFMNEKCKEFTSDNKLNFVLTSAICPKAMKYLLKLDRSVYGNILNVTDKKNYTNGHENISFDKDNLSYIEKMINLVNGGLTCNFKLSKGLSLKKQNEYIKQVLDYNIPFFKLTFGKEEEL